MGASWQLETSEPRLQQMGSGARTLASCRNAEKVRLADPAFDVEAPGSLVRRFVTSGGPIPNLFIIGAMKSGTSSLHSYLSTHPEIFMCEPKEPAYFVLEEGWSRGEAWYRSLFEAAGDARIIGESSTSYSKRPTYDGVVERIAAFSPDARFIYIMRDPVERTISQYWHMVRWHGEARDMLSAIRSSCEYRDNSHYAMQLQPYFARFGRDRVLCLTFEAMLAGGPPVIQDIFRWLGVDGGFVPPNLSDAENVTPKHLTQVRRAAGLLNSLRHSAYWNALGPRVPAPLRRVGRLLSEKQVERLSQPTDEVVAHLRPRQRVETDDLVALLDRPFPEWTTLYGTGPGRP